MKKVRVYELAKEIGMESKVLTAKLIDLGYDVKAYNSSLEEGEASEIKTRLSGGGSAKVKAAPPAEKEEVAEAVSETVTTRTEVDDTSSDTCITTTEVEDKRIQAKGKTTIIRRRRKTVQEEIPVEEIVETPEVLAETGNEEKPTPEPLVPEDKIEDQPEVIAEAELEATELEEDKVSQTQEVDSEQAESEVGGEVLETPEVEVEAEKPEAEEVTVKAIDETNKPPKPDKNRAGLARMIKKSAIHIPVEEKRVKPAPKRHIKPRPSRPAGGAAERPKRYQAAPSSPKFPGGDAPAKGSGDKPGAQGKKGKRFVKFHHEPGGKGKKGGKRKGFSTVDMEDVAMAGGRFSSALKLDRSRGGKKNKHSFSGDASEAKAIKKRIKIQETISIGDFAHRMGVRANEVIAKLMGLGVMATVNQAVDVDTATLVATEFGYEVEQALTEELSIFNLEEEESGGEMESRPPVVTVMGHVDHGKTSILDAIRNTDVADGEAGGITQHIGAHYVRSAQGDVVFLDTPGHAAFTEMRSRGAKVTDIVVLVVAADDGVMEQTKEAINHAKAAGVPIVVAVNKIDKEGADPMRVKSELAEFELTPEEWGGDTIFCETSAKQNIGIEELLEQILLQAEILELKADKKRKARGRVVEARIHKGRGPVATILIQQGTLRTGDAFVVGEHYGKIKSLHNDKGIKIQEGEPAWPVEIQGLSGVPMSGDEFVVVKDEKMAKNVSAQRSIKSRESQLGHATKISLDNLFDKLQEGKIKELTVLLRADVQGTLQAFSKALDQLGTDEIKVKVVHEGTGAIIDSDILLAAASDAIIIGFNVRPSAKVQEFAAKENVDIRYYDVIYNALDDIRDAMVGLLDPVFQERVIGSLEVRDTFVVPKIGTIAGCYVNDGKIERKAQVRLVRDGIVIYTGKITSLRRFKDDVKEVAGGYECGVGLENYNDLKENDVLEVFVMDQIAAKL